MEMILFCVMFTSRDDWDSPTVVFVKATDRDKAYFAALKKIGLTEEEADVMKEQGEYDDVIIVVDDVIHEDYELEGGCDSDQHLRDKFPANVEGSDEFYEAEDEELEDEDYEPSEE